MPRRKAQQPNPALVNFAKLPDERKILSDVGEIQELINQRRFDDLDKRLSGIDLSTADTGQITFYTFVLPMTVMMAGGSLPGLPAFMERAQSRLRDLGVFQ